MPQDFRKATNVQKKENAKRSSSRRGSKSRSLLWYPTSTPTKIHFQRGSYGEDGSGYHIGYRHWMPGFSRTGGKGVYVKCGGDGECLVCAMADPQAAGLSDVAPDIKMAKFQSRPYVAVPVWVEEKFHLATMKRRDGEGTYTARVRCEGYNCEYCKEKDPKVFGKRAYAEFSVDQWITVFKPLADSAAMYDRSGEQLLLYCYTCPECNEMLIDFLGQCNQCEGENIAVDVEEGKAMCQDCQAEWSIYPHENPKLYDDVNTDVQCGSCGNVVRPEPYYGFSDDPNREGVDPYDIYDLQINLAKADDGKLVIKDWNIQEPDERLFQPEHQGNDEAAQSIAKRHAEVLDLEDLLAPPPASSVAKTLGVPNILGKSEAETVKTYSN